MEHLLEQATTLSNTENFEKKLKKQPVEDCKLSIPVLYCLNGNLYRKTVPAGDAQQLVC